LLEYFLLGRLWHIREADEVVVFKDFFATGASLSVGSRDFPIVKGIFASDDPDFIFSLEYVLLASKDLQAKL